MTETEIKEVVRKVLSQQGLSANISDNKKIIPIEASARHVHLTEEAVKKLFGEVVKLKNKRNLSQPGEFLSEQRVKLVTAKGEITNVAILGPERKAVQVELSMTDCIKLGIKAPVNLSGNLKGAGDVLIVGENGIFEAKGSVIVAQNHIHMTPSDATSFDVKNGDVVRVALDSARPLTFDKVFVRVNSNFSLAMHIDFDEANACTLGKDATGRLLKK
ncbi:MAG TPA: phosphate propanoyltransferase [Clostridia bacterium]|nr:phosphate propanoyltransferase [Clostridia bacterium]